MSSIGVIRIRPQGMRPIRFRPIKFRPGTLVTRYQRYPGRYRIADTALILYELYIGVDAEPDLTLAPDATSATLPFSEVVAIPGSGERTFYSVVRKRNEYNLLSLNRYSRKITIDSAGALVVQVPTAPADGTLEDYAGGKLTVTAHYFTTWDADPADTWLIYSRSNGTDPDTGIDTPAEVAMTAGGLFPSRKRLQELLGAYTFSADVRVILRTMRSSDSAKSIDSDVLQINVGTFAPPLAGDSGHTFIGTEGVENA